MAAMRGRRAGSLLVQWCAGRAREDWGRTALLRNKRLAIVWGGEEGAGQWQGVVVGRIASSPPVQAHPSSPSCRPGLNRLWRRPHRTRAA